MSHALKTLQTYFSYQAFRPGQQDVIEHTLKQKNALVVMPTGSGKSLCFQIPALILNGITIVVSPLIALMKDQVDQLVRLKIPATFINSSIHPEEQNQRLHDMAEGAYKIIYIAPERFSSAAFMEVLRPLPIALFAIDEAHCISQWGHDFRPSYLRLKEVIKKLNNPPVLALTATATQRVQQDILDQLQQKKITTFVSGFDRPNLKLFCIDLGEEKKRKEIIRIIRAVKGAGIVYVATKKAVSTVVSFLKDEGIAAIGYHGGMEKQERSAVQNDWLANNTPVIVATNAFGMGIDKADVRFVIHYNSPGSMEAYYQEAGRAGRDGRTSYCLLFHSYRDRRIQEFLIDNSFPDEETIRTIWDYLIRLNQQEIYLTYKEIASASGVHEMQTAAAIKTLEKLKLLQRMTKTVLTFQATLLVSDQRALSQTKRAPQQHKLINYFVSQKSTTFQLQETLSFLEMQQEQFQATIHSLEKKKLIQYTPPFRGRGIEIIASPTTEWEKLTFDWSSYLKQKELQHQKLNEVENYVQGSECRRSYILHYFGEKPQQSRCNKCDVCLQWRSPEAGTVEKTGEDPLKTIVHCVWEFDGNFGITTIANILKGNSEKRFSLRRIDETLYFGAFKQFDLKEIMSLIYRALKNMYIRKQGNDYPVLYVTNNGISFLRK